MGRQFNVTVPRPKHNQEGTWWHNVGNAFENDKGQISVYFNSLPIPDDKGVVKVMLFEKTDKDEQPAQSRTAARKPAMSGGKRDDMDDEIPF